MNPVRLDQAIVQAVILAKRPGATGKRIVRDMKRRGYSLAEIAEALKAVIDPKTSPLPKETQP